MKIPKRLDVSRSCFYQLPADTTPRQMLGYEITYRQQYKDAVHSVSGTVIFFQLKNAESRDWFLNVLEARALENSVIVERVFC